MASYERQVRAAERQAELEHWYELNQQLLSLAFVHEDEFPDAVPPVAPPATAVDEKEVLGRHEHEQLAGVSIFKRRERRAAKERARSAAAEEVERERLERERAQAALQASLDEQWQRLLANDHDVVFHTIEAAFEDNEMPAAVLDVSGASVTLLMRISSPDDLIPEREVTQTPTGKPTHKRRTKRVVNALYAEIMASHSVATAKEALAVAPALDGVRLLVIRGDRLGGGLQLIPLYTGEFDRRSVEPTEWKDINVLGFIEAHGNIKYRGQAQEVAALSTRNDLELRATLQEIAAHLNWKPAA
jgi:hypothetical protein